MKQLMKILSTVGLIISFAPSTYAQVNFDIERISDTELILTGTGNLSCTAPSQRPYLIGLNFVFQNAGGVHWSSNTLNIGGVPVTNYSVDSEGTLNFNSNNSVPFPAHGVVTGSVTITAFPGSTIYPVGTTGDVFWGLHNDIGWTIDVGDFVIGCANNSDQPNTDLTPQTGHTITDVSLETGSDNTPALLKNRKDRRLCRRECKNVPGGG